jgi:pyruvate dehydrogenase E2 component (dihydrolipoamide acetyltransferase)
MATVVIMPKQGQSVETCAIVSWKKRLGDAVRLGEVICDVETDKATFEVESTAEGTLLAILHEAGSDVPVLAPIAVIGAPGENVAQAAAAQAVSAAPVRAVPVSAAPVPVVPASTPAPQQAGETLSASPRARALAGSRGVSLAGLRGTGPGGRIIERDVEASYAQGQPLTPAARAAAAGGAVSAEGTGIGGRVRAADVAAQSVARTSIAQPSPGAVTEIKVTGVRKLIAERMLASLQSTAQLTLSSAADAHALLDLRSRFKESPETLGLRDVTINDMVLFAVSRALLAHRDVNAHFSGDTIRQYADVHLAFATDTPRGLMVPVIRNAHSLSLRAISKEAGRLAAACREGGIKLDEMQGGTFTVTNLGGLGIESFTPVLNPPQVAILGVGSIVARPVIGAGGTASFVPHIGLSLTINHQVVDGAPGARFLQTLAGSLASLDLLLAQ